MVGTCQNTTTNCSLARVWTQANDSLRQQLENITLARMIEEDHKNQTLTYQI
jgi:DNA-binding IscR family transcriptional regulator